MKDAARSRTDEVRLAELIMPNHTNHQGNLFGGHALGLMDHAGWVAATRCARLNMVTVASDRVEFKVPVRAGQLVELVAKVSKVGITSVTVGVDMFAEDVATGERRLATSGSFVFVAIDEHGRPVPIEAGEADRVDPRGEPTANPASERFGAPQPYSGASPDPSAQDETPSRLGW